MVPPARENENLTQYVSSQASHEKATLIKKDKFLLMDLSNIFSHDFLNLKNPKKYYNNQNLFKGNPLDNKKFRKKIMIVKVFLRVTPLILKNSEKNMIV